MGDKPYMILWGETDNDLEDRVETYMKKGYRPTGGVIFIPDRGDTSQSGFFQAVLREDKDHD